MSSKKKISTKLWKLMENNTSTRNSPLMKITLLGSRTSLECRRDSRISHLAPLENLLLSSWTKTMWRQLCTFLMWLQFGIYAEMTTNIQCLRRDLNGFTSNWGESIEYWCIQEILMGQWQQWEAWSGLMALVGILRRNGNHSSSTSRWQVTLKIAMVWHLWLFMEQVTCVLSSNLQKPI